MLYGGKKKSLVIADVLRTGEKLSTRDEEVHEYGFPGLQLAVSALPADVFGGDIHGVVSLTGGITAVFIGDVSGHDFEATIIATDVIQYIEDNSDELLYPRAFFQKFNRKQYFRMIMARRFLTMAICVINVAHDRVTYSSAGHPFSLLIRSDGTSCLEMGQNMLPVGIEKHLHFYSEDYPFSRGDRVVMFTDGIVGARNGEKKEFGPAGVLVAAGESGLDAGTSVRRILHANTEFANTSENRNEELDDRTIICGKHL